MIAEEPRRSVVLIVTVDYPESLGDLVDHDAMVDSSDEAPW
jgi:hypothetical protein